MGKYHFTDPELKTLSADLARNCAKLQEVEDEKKEMASNYKAKIDAATSAINSVARDINNGYEHRYFECETEKDFDSGNINFIDMESGNLIESRKMTAEEYQLKTTDKTK